MLAEISGDVVRVWGCSDEGELGWRDAKPDEVVPCLVRIVGDLQEKLARIQSA